MPQTETVHVYSEPVMAAAGDAPQALGIIALKTQPKDSCDVIIMNNGDEIRAIIREINPEAVKYKKCDMPGGPDFVSLKSDIFMIRYTNGRKEIFEKHVKKAAPAETTGAASIVRTKTHPMAILSLVFGNKHGEQNEQAYHKNGEDNN